MRGWARSQQPVCTSAQWSKSWGCGRNQAGAPPMGVGTWLPAPGFQRRSTSSSIAAAGSTAGGGTAGSTALAGRVYLITGSTDGIGLHTAQRLATAGAAVVLHGRHAGRLDEAVQRVRRAAPGAAVHSYLADFSNLSQVRGLADEVATRHERIDVLINNAGEAGRGRGRCAPPTRHDCRQRHPPVPPCSPHAPPPRPLQACTNPRAASPRMASR